MEDSNKEQNKLFKESVNVNKDKKTNENGILWKTKYFSQCNRKSS